MAAELRFTAMGSQAHVVVLGGPPGLLDHARRRIAELEGRWSRFLDTSEISALSRHAGAPVLVSADTYALVSRSVVAWEATGGRFDPTVGAALAAHGYDRDFPTIGDDPVAAAPTGPAPGCGAIVFDPSLGAVTLPPGVVFDPGGIGKGFAADLVTAELMEAGAWGAMVNLGGDLRARGEAPGEDGWVVTVDDPFDSGRELVRFAIPDGAVATTSRGRRRWPTTGGEAHHIIDPAAGAPADTDVVAVTVVAGEAWWAEVLAKARFLDGPVDLPFAGGVVAVVVTADGSWRAGPALREAVR